jgi:cysteine desulfurase
LHSDTVQSIGKKEIDLKELPIDFWWPVLINSTVLRVWDLHSYGKNSGFTAIYFMVNKKRMRAGTEAVHQIAGMAKALDFLCQLKRLRAQPN